MRIECPACKASGNINEHELPDEGRLLACPRCKEQFHIAKPRKKATSPFATNTCPSCGYSTFCEEVFDECPHCGSDVKVAMERKREEETRKREQEILNRNYRATPGEAVILPTATDIAPQPDTILQARSFAELTDAVTPVTAVGWGMVTVSAVLLCLGCWGLLHYWGTDIQAQLSEQSIEPVSAWQVFWGYGFLPWVEFLVGSTLLVAAWGFLKRVAWGQQGMLWATRGLLLLVPVYELTSYVIWIVNAIAPPWWAYLVELLSSLFIAGLLMLPLYLLLRYQQGNSFQLEYRRG